LTAGEVAHLNPIVSSEKLKMGTKKGIF
jgi:hypothetical protein